MNAQEISELSRYLKSLPRLADEGKDARIEKAKTDFWYFIKTYFPHHVDGAQTDYSCFRKFVHENIDLLTRKHKKIIFKAYRNSAKTTTVSQLFTLWKVAKKEVRNVVVLGATDDTVGELFDFYKTECEDNANFKYEFNLSFPSTWKEKNIIVGVDGQQCRIKGYGSGKKSEVLSFYLLDPTLLLLTILRMTNK